jgi:hypothetical protein
LVSLCSLGALWPWNALIPFRTLGSRGTCGSHASLRPLRSRNALVAFCALGTGRPLLALRSYRTLFSFGTRRGFGAGHKRQSPEDEPTNDD